MCIYDAGLHTIEENKMWASFAGITLLSMTSFVLVTLFRCFIPEYCECQNSTLQKY